MIGQKIDNYQILEVRGRGGMGVVYKAIDLNLQKTVALKMIDPFYARNESFVKRFRTEAIALAKLENKNIVSVYALRETDNGLFMVMEYVPSKTVSEWLKEEGYFSVTDTIKITRQLLNAINHAHKVGVIHRDIKPNNILLNEDGTVKVMDFGLAKLMQEHGEQSTLTQTAGTLYYMSPEQIKGTKVDNRSDIYSIGMTIYEMLTGRVPFEKGTGEYNIQKQIIEGRIESPENYNPGIPKTLIKFIMKAIDKNPDKRFQNITDMLSELYHFETTEKASYDKTIVIPENGSAQNGYYKKRKNTLVIFAGLIIILIFSVYMIFIKPEKPEKKFSSIFIDSSPQGALVLINNDSVGNTPFTKDSLALKKYAIVLKKKGFEDWLDPNVSLTQNTHNIFAHLVPKSESKPQIQLPPKKKPEPTSQLNSTLIMSAVPSADIFIDKKKILSNSNETVRDKLVAGDHFIKFVNPEFGSKEINLNLSEKEIKSITCYFQQQVNIQSLNVYGDAFWGTIYVNEKNTGKTTPSDMLLGPGQYKITVKKAGYETVEKDVVLNVEPTLNKLKTHSLVFHLK